MAKRTLKVGIIGYGMIGKVHAYATATLPWFAPQLDVVGKVVAVATSRFETARRAQEQIGCPLVYDDYRALIANPEIDVVHICTPNAEHLPALLEAIRADKHVYCEKPIVAGPDEAETLRRALAESASSKVHGVAHHLRGFTALRRAKELIEEGRLGRIVQYRVGYYHSSMLDSTRPWRWKHGEKGGTIFDLGSHLFDLVGWLIGRPAQGVANASIWTPRRPVTEGSSETRDVVAEDAVSILTRGALDGAAQGLATTGVVEATKLTNGAEDELKLEISGTEGSLRFSLMDSHYLEFFDARVPFGKNGGSAGWTRIPSGARYEAPESDFPSPKSTTGWLRAHVAALAGFYQGISEGGRPRCASFEDALQTQKVLTAVAESARRNQWIDVEK